MALCRSYKLSYITLLYQYSAADNRIQAVSEETLETLINLRLLKKAAGVFNRSSKLIQTAAILKCCRIGISFLSITVVYYVLVAKVALL